MADYYSLLARKIGPLPQSTPQARQATYELARRALVNQLRAIQPPVPETVILNEGRALDEAIARLEREVGPGPGAARQPAPPSSVAPPPAPRNEPPRLREKLRPAAPLPPSSVAPPPAPRDEPPPPREKLRPAAPLPPPPDRSAGSRRIIGIAAVLIVIVGLIALAALRLRERPEDLAKLNPEESAASDSEQGKISARAGGEGGDALDQAQQTAPVARRAALLVAPKQHTDKPDKVYDGSVVWRLENIGGDEGGPVQSAIRGDVDFPAAKFKASIVIQKNEDPTLSASHTINISFFIAPDSELKSVKAIGAFQMRRPESQSGERLIGIPVPTTENSFLIGLMRGDSEKRNINLLRSPSLIDIPLQFADERIGTINLEKGPTGDRVFQDAIAAWTGGSAKP